MTPFHYLAPETDLRNFKSAGMRPTWLHVVNSKDSRKKPIPPSTNTHLSSRAPHTPRKHFTVLNLYETPLLFNITHIHLSFSCANKQEKTSSTRSPGVAHSEQALLVRYIDGIPAIARRRFVLVITTTTPPVPAVIPRCRGNGQSVASLLVRVPTPVLLHVLLDAALKRG